MEWNLSPRATICSAIGAWLLAIFLEKTGMITPDIAWVIVGLSSLLFIPAIIELCGFKRSSKASPNATMFSSDQRQILGKKVKGYASSDSNISVLFATLEQKSFAELLISVFQANGWKTNLTNKEQGILTSPYIEHIEVSGHNKHLVEAIADTLRDAGLTEVKTKIEPLELGESNPKWNWAQHKIQILIGNKVTEFGCMGLAVDTDQWLVPADKLGSKIIPIAASIVIIAVTAWHFWPRQQIHSLGSGDIKILGFEPHLAQEGKKARVNIHFSALKPTKISMNYRMFVINNPPPNTEDIWQLEEEFWSVTMTPGKGADVTLAIPPDMEMVSTLLGSVMTSDQVVAWKTGNMFVYFMGQVKYANDNGNGSIDFCVLQPRAESIVMLCKNHNGPSASQ
jgi:hypothetical protein